MVWLAPLLIGVNHMDLITTITGDFGGASLGWGLASLDFNGDGIKDLAVLEKAWNPSGIYDFNHFIGRIYFYWGGQTLTMWQILPFLVHITESMELLPGWSMPET
jgi:hypothetical protein